MGIASAFGSAASAAMRPDWSAYAADRRFRCAGAADVLASSTFAAKAQYNILRRQRRWRWRLRLYHRINRRRERQSRCAGVAVWLSRRDCSTVRWHHPYLRSALADAADQPLSR